MTGCEETYNKAYKKDVNDFEKQLTCLSIASWMKVGLSTTFLTKKPDSNFTPLINISPSQKDLSTASTSDFVTYPIKEDEKKYLPLISFKSNNKDGLVFLMNFNPMFEKGYKKI